MGNRVGKAKIMRLLAQIEEYKLSTPAWFKELDVATIQKNYNGAGPDWMNHNCRHIITWMLSIFEPAYLIHDLEFTKSDQSIHGFNHANDRMWTNIRKIINYEFSLVNPLNWLPRCKWYLKGKASYLACKRHGWSAWKDITK
jgi:hypothetical protein